MRPAQMEQNGKCEPNWRSFVVEVSSGRHELRSCYQSRNTDLIHGVEAADLLRASLTALTGPKSTHRPLETELL